MKVISHRTILDSVVTHPYDCNPGYSGKIHTFHYSPDQRLLMGYWEAPPGWFEVEIGEQTELNYVLQGEIQISSEGGALGAGQGDCFVVYPGEKLHWQVIEHIRTIYVIYPADNEIVAYFKQLEDPS